jgi:RHS repeat-associated protein
VGSTSITANSGGGWYAEQRYKPWGEQRYPSGASTLPTRHRFTGQIEDVEIGLYFYNARYYSSALGRFVSADTIVPSPSDPQSLNRFSYVRNRPLNRIDPSGHQDRYDEGGGGSPPQSDFPRFSEIAGPALVVVVSFFSEPLEYASTGVQCLSEGCTWGDVALTLAPGGFSAVKKLVNVFDTAADAARAVENGADILQAGENAEDVFKVGKHGAVPSPRPGMQSHHGVMSAWMKEHFPGYDPDMAPAILMPKANHEKTFGVFNTWRAKMKEAMGGVFDWSKITESDMRALSEQMFDAAGVPSNIRAQYWQEFERMKQALPSK